MVQQVAAFPLSDKTFTAAILTWTAIDLISLIENLFAFDTMRNTDQIPG